MALIVRASAPEDAEIVASLGRQFVDCLRSLSDPDPQSLTAEEYFRDGFGENPAFSGLIAELAGQPVGYLLYHHGSDIDRGGRIFYVIGLFVRDDARCRGVGRALMEAAADICRQVGGRELFWSVYSPTKVAQAFYEHLGAKYTKDLKFMHWPVSPP
jgi:GNAT superfamily N-acetyltransferase